jgi:hypothetical protein
MIRAAGLSLAKITPRPFPAIALSIVCDERTSTTLDKIWGRRVEAGLAPVSGPAGRPGGATTDGAVAAFLGGAPAWLHRVLAAGRVGHRDRAISNDKRSRRPAQGSTCTWVVTHTPGPLALGPGTPVCPDPYDRAP